jgi:hypothetical protein
VCSHASVAAAAVAVAAERRKAKEGGFRTAYSIPHNGWGAEDDVSYIE